MLNVNGILIRDVTEADLPFQDAYFESASDEYLRMLGVDPAAIRDFKRDYTGFRKYLATPLEERDIHSYIFEKDGRIIGSSALKAIVFGESAEIHGHIYHPELRNTGLVSSILPEYLKLAFDTFQLETLIAEPSAQNAAPNRLLQKLGFKKIRSYESPAQGILLARTANRYEIAKEVVEGLSARSAQG